MDVIIVVLLVLCLVLLAAVAFKVFTAKSAVIQDNSEKIGMMISASNKELREEVG